jgi:hypothetical protein
MSQPTQYPGLYTLNENINLALLRLTKRAEMSDPKVLVDTFVDTGMLQAMLGSRDHQVIYGRRGTGKTHALLYLFETKRKANELPIFVDMRTIGSSIGLFADESIPLAERATRLLRDTLTAIHSSLYELATAPGETLNLGVVGPQLDAFIEASTETQVLGTTVVESQENYSGKSTSGFSTSASLSPKSASASASISDERELSRFCDNKWQESGQSVHRVRFGAIGQTLGAIVASAAPRRIWLLLDEWSAVPTDLQPYLADMIRRCLLPTAGVTVKIAAIEQRTNFKLPGYQGEYTGFELGADLAADLNLDDFMVFDNNASRATEFFRSLIFKHYNSVQPEAEGAPAYGNERDFAAAVFTQRTAVEELVRAAEGVPRDAIYVLSLSAQKAVSSPIAVAHVRSAAKTWYQRDKESAVSANTQAATLLRWIVDEVIAHRRARAFLVESGARDSLVDSLFDSRVLHLLKRNISAQDEPGVRYDAYKIDYGCYVDLLSTAREPQGTLPMGSEGDDEAGSYIDVPPDDYRAIRRAILILGDFYGKQSLLQRAG